VKNGAIPNKLSSMDTTPTPTANDGFMKRMLDVVEKAGNKVAHPAMIFLFLMVVVKAVLAAYRVADSPMNVITPLNAYFALVVVFAQKYDKNAGVGTIVALMIPYVLAISAIWTLLFVVWFLLGLPWGL